MFWVIQSIGVLTIFCTLMSLFQREKYKMMIWLSLTNITMGVVYALIGNYLAALLVGGALFRTVLYFFYNVRNKKPNTIVPVMFSIYYIVISIVMWNSWLNLMMLLNVLLVTYISWQNNPTILRIGYIGSALLLLPFDICWGAYTVAASEVVLLIEALVGLPQFIKSTQLAKDIAQKYFAANKEFWGSEVSIKEGYDLVISDTADKSCYYNMGIIKDFNNMFNVIKNIQKEMKKRKLPETAYIPFDPATYDAMKDSAHVLQMFFPVVFYDTWMRLIDGYNLNDIRCKILGVEHCEVDEKSIDQIISTYLKGYHAKKDIEDLNDNEKLQVEHLRKVDFEDKVEKDFTTHAYLSYYKGEPISLVCVLTNGHDGYITKVCTIPAFRRKHIASSLMQYAISSQRKKGTRNFVLVTDKYSTNEKFYAYNSFVEFAQGYAYDVSDTTKYEKFLKTNIVE